MMRPEVGLELLRLRVDDVVRRASKPRIAASPTRRPLPRTGERR
jgi:hypothetical protein